MQAWVGLPKSGAPPPAQPSTSNCKEQDIPGFQLRGPSRYCVNELPEDFGIDDFVASWTRRHEPIEILLWEKTETYRIKILPSRRFLGTCRPFGRQMTASRMLDTVREPWSHKVDKLMRKKEDSR